MGKTTLKKQTQYKFELKDFSFLYDNVLVKALRPETVEGLVKPDQYDDKPEFGEVIQVGEGRLLDDGVVVPTKLKVGDIIFFGKYSSEQTRSVGEDYFIIREDDVRAVLKKNA